MNSTPSINDILVKLKGAVREGDHIFLPSELLQISGELAEQTEHPGRTIAVVNFRVTHPRLFPNGFTDFAVGMGETLELACQDAVRVWCEGALTTIMHANKGEDACECGVVTRATLTSLTTDQTPVIWDVFVGPLQGSGMNAEHIKVDHLTILKAILNALTGELYQRKVLWIRAVMTRYEKQVQNECYSNNATWDPGLQSLYGVTKAWGVIDGFLIHRQCIICVPTDRKPDPETVADLQQRNATVYKPAPGERKWWQFWKN